MSCSYSMPAEITQGIFASAVNCTCRVISKKWISAVASLGQNEEIRTSASAEVWHSLTMLLNLSTEKKEWNAVCIKWTVCIMTALKLQNNEILSTLTPMHYTVLLLLLFVFCDARVIWRSSLLFKGIILVQCWSMRPLASLCWKHMWSEEKGTVLLIPSHPSVLLSRAHPSQVRAGWADPLRSLQRSVRHKAWLNLTTSSRRDLCV